MTTFQDFTHSLGLVLFGLPKVTGKPCPKCGKSLAEWHTNRGKFTVCVNTGNLSVLGCGYHVITK